MQTQFTKEQLADPRTREAEAILRKCVHCGFCTATCPTYVLDGDERDSPRGRIYLIKETLEQGRPADATLVKHIDRCLSCLACVTTCPSGVDYMHLVDQARAHIEKTYERPWLDRMTRALLAQVLPYPGRFRLASALGRAVRPLAKVFKPSPLRAMLQLTPKHGPPVQDHGAEPFTSPRKVAILAGCAQSVLDDGINAAATRLLNRLGVEVCDVPGEACCGAIVHHLGKEEQALAFARANVDAWWNVHAATPLEAILITTSGCGTTIKDYAHMLRRDSAYAEKAAMVSALARDITEYLAAFDLPPPVNGHGMVIAYHAACSLQHGQKITAVPKNLLLKAGFTVKEPRESHLCCGSAGTYNILQPEIAGRLRARKVANLQALNPDVIAAGNIGCLTQIGVATPVPVVHTVKLLDWASGGLKPPEIF